MLIRKESIWLNQGHTLEYTLANGEILLEVAPQFHYLQGTPDIPQEDIHKFVRVVYKKNPTNRYYGQTNYQFQVICPLVEEFKGIEVLLLIQSDNAAVQIQPGQGIELLTRILEDFSYNRHNHQSIDSNLLRELVSAGLETVDLRQDLLNDEYFIDELRLRLNILTSDLLMEDLITLKSQIDPMIDQQKNVNSTVDTFKKELEKKFEETFEKDRKNRTAAIKVLQESFEQNLEKIEELKKSITKQDELVEGYRNKMRAMRKSRVI